MKQFYFHIEMGTLSFGVNFPLQLHQIDFQKIKQFGVIVYAYFLSS